MSDFLQRLAARSNGSQAGGIRPLPTHPLIWAAANDRPRVSSGHPKPNPRLREATLQGRIPDDKEQHPATSGQSRRTPGRRRSTAGDAPASAPQTTASLTPAAHPGAVMPLAIDIIRQPAEKTGLVQPAEGSSIQSLQTSRPLEAPVPPVAPALPLAPTPLKAPLEAAAVHPSPPPTPTVEISIGTLEVGILTPPAPATPAPPKRRQSAATRLSLNDYLQRRNRAAGGGLA